MRKIGGESEGIDYYQFCVLLDAGTNGNPSRVSSYLSNKGSGFMKYSYFEKNIYNLDEEEKKNKYWCKKIKRIKGY